MSGIPSQAQIDNSREALERAQMKLGKVQARAILSGAQAKADLAELERANKTRDDAEADYVALVARFTQTDQVAVATRAIRDRLQPQADQDAAVRKAGLFVLGQSGAVAVDPASAKVAAEADPSLGDIYTLGDVEADAAVRPPTDGA